MLHRNYQATHQPSFSFLATFPRLLKCHTLCGSTFRRALGPLQAEDLQLAASRQGFAGKGLLESLPFNQSQERKGSAGRRDSQAARWTSCIFREHSACKLQVPWHCTFGRRVSDLQSFSWIPKHLGSVQRSCSSSGTSERCSQTLVHMLVFWKNILATIWKGTTVKCRNWGFIFTGRKIQVSAPS